MRRLECRITRHGSEADRASSSWRPERIERHDQVNRAAAFFEMIR